MVVVLEDRVLATDSCAFMNIVTALWISPLSGILQIAVGGGAASNSDIHEVLVLLHELDVLNIIIYVRAYAIS